MNVLNDDIGGIAQVDTDLFEQGAVFDTYDGDVAATFDLDHIRRRVTTDRRGIGVADGSVHINDDRVGLGGAIAKGLVDLGSGACGHHVTAGAAGGRSAKALQFRRTHTTGGRAG